MEESTASQEGLFFYVVPQITKRQLLLHYLNVPLGPMVCQVEFELTWGVKMLMLNGE